MSTRDNRYQQFWQGLYNYMSNRNGAVALPVISDMNYVKFAPMQRGFRLCAAFNTEEPSRKVELLITGKKAGDYAQRLKSQHAEIEAEVGSELDWNVDLKSEKKVSLWNHGVYVFAGLPTDHYAWTADKLELLHRVFKPRIRQLTGS